VLRIRICLGALALLSAGPARAAEVSGVVEMPRKGWARDAVISLEGEKKAAPLKNIVIDQRDKLFIPHVTVVTRGTKVAFPNNDTVFHNVFAYYNAKKFDLGFYPRGKTEYQTFDKTGVVALLCNIHSEMSAYILVVDTPFYAVTDKNGRFRILGVEPGTYTLTVWHESGAKLSQTVKVEADNAEMKLKLVR
jgi:plastocyanin